LNERIEKLAEQATSIVESPKNAYGWGSSYAYFDKEKFAELIVKECVERASIGNGHGNNQWDRALTFAAKNIKEHFGVEE
jgi:hypothetical protein